MKRISFLIIILFTFSCKVVLITGYDEVLDESVTKMKRDFNLHFIKLIRTLQDDDPNNQHINNFNEYYDNLQADLICVNDRTKFLNGKSAIVKKQIQNLDSIMIGFMMMHKQGFRDSRIDDHRSERNAVNSSFDAIIKLQEELKSTGKTKDKQ